MKGNQTFTRHSSNPWQTEHDHIAKFPVAFKVNSQVLHPSLTIITVSKLVELPLLWYFAHLTLKLALRILLQLLAKEREDLLAPHDSLPELTHTSVSI